METVQRKRVVVIAPHADDAELGVGGYIHRLSTDKDYVVDVYVVAQGDNSSNGKKSPLGSKRRKEGVDAGTILGVREYEFLDLAPDSQFGTIPMGTLVAGLEKVIFAKEPIDQLFFNCPSFHPDHNVLHSAMISALRPHLNRTFPRQVFMYEYPGCLWATPMPHLGKVYIPLTGYDLDAKLNSLKAHQSQPVSDVRSLYGAAGVQSLALMRGAEFGTTYAECVYAVRGVL